MLDLRPQHQTESVLHQGDLILDKGAEQLLVGPAGRVGEEDIVAQRAGSVLVTKSVDEVLAKGQFEPMLEVKVEDMLALLLKSVLSEEVPVGLELHVGPLTQRLLVAEQEVAALIMERLGHRRQQGLHRIDHVREIDAASTVPVMEGA